MNEVGRRSAARARSGPPGWDPMLRYLVGTDVPAAFWSLPTAERSVRLRYRLVCWCAGLSDAMVWHLTMDPSAEGAARVMEIVSLWPDDRLQRALADAARRRAGLPVMPVFEGRTASVDRMLQDLNEPAAPTVDLPGGRPSRRCA
jgi:hypothetical protein